MYVFANAAPVKTCSFAKSELKVMAPCFTVFWLFHENYCNTQLWAHSVHLLQC